jgi:hypothetical protein
MMATARDMLRRVPVAKATWRFAKGIKYRREIQALQSLPVFDPNSAGTPTQKLRLALLDAKQVFPFMIEVVKASGVELLPIVRAEDFPQNDDERQCAAALALLFNRYGSDKSTSHNYHHVYGAILARCGNVAAMLEVGLGTNNEDVVSNMTSGGRPGASLRAFRDYLGHGMVYGADIDKRVLFQEDRIKTFFVDQTDLSTIDQLRGNLPAMLDLVIDDGLHTPAANLAILKLALEVVRPAGWVVIEDIARAAVPVWQVVARLLPSWECHIIDANHGFLFLARRAV